METVRRNAEQALARHKIAPCRRPDRPQPGPAGAPGGPRPGRRAAADRVLRRLHVQGTETSSRRWSSSRTACRASASTAGSRVRGGRDGTRRHRRDARGADPAVPALPRRARRPVRARARRRRGPRRPGQPGRPGRRRTAGPGRIDPDTGRPRKFAYPPQPRRRRRRAAAGRRGRARRWPSSASTTSPWSAWPSGSRRSGCPGDEYPVILPRTSEGLYLLQRVRDEAHRFAITFHRQRRSKAMTASALDAIPGLGETRRKALLRHFGSVKQVRRPPSEADRARSRASAPRWPRPSSQALRRAGQAGPPSTSPPVRSSTRPHTAGAR